jgi:hypothetical protein
MFAWKKSPPTAIKLLSFRATGDQGSVKDSWQTAQEIDNVGFHLYRAESPGGPFTRLTDRLIPGLTFSVMGRSYTYRDGNVTPGRLYYYRLEDVDTSGKRTFHGPICVDWDGDGMPDDWEIAHGLDPTADDSRLDPDFDGLTNLEEYLYGTDPLNPDTDGDTVLDGQESRNKDGTEPSRTGNLTQATKIISSDETGVTLELWTDAFDTQTVQVEGETYERLRILHYIHGLTQGIGKPEIPVKGILIDLPQGKSATLTIQDTESQIYSDRWVYPVPEKVTEGEGGVVHVGEVFAMDAAAYRTDAFYPNEIAQLGETFTFRGQKKLQVLFHPLVFNPAKKELVHYTRIRVRLDYESRGTLAGSFMAATASVSSSGATSAWSPPSPETPYRILTTAEGIYRLSRAELEANGVNVAAMDLSQVRLYHLGQEVALSVHDQDGNNQFDVEDYIVFYAPPVASQYAKYARYNVFWLTTSGGFGAAKRMTAIDAAPAGGPVAASHSFSFHFEEDSYYWMGAPGADSLDRWIFPSFALGDGIQGGGGPVDFTFTLPGVPENGAETVKGDLTLSLCGVYDTDHQVEVSVNGADPETYTWSSIGFYQVSMAAVDILPGDNTVTLRCKTSVDSIAVDWVMVDYQRDFAAVQDSLMFSHQPGYLFQVSGFAGGELMAFDITSPGDVTEVIDGHTTSTDSYSLAFEPPQDGGGVRTYLALSSDAVKTPVAISGDAASNLADSTNGADYILITHRDLGWDASGDRQQWLEDLVALRQAQGLRVQVVDVVDVFDEFSYGMVTPQAIRDFLTFAYANWTPPAIQYVLLVGDGTYDYKDNLDLGTTNFVPPYLSFTEFMGETVTDDWFARVSGNDAIPDLYIGRLPASSAAEAGVMVSKIVSYEQAVNTKTWEKHIALVADNKLEPYEALFKIMNEEVAQLIPAGFDPPFRGYLDDYWVPWDLTADITEKINAGALLLHYSGHGSVQIWTHENIFDHTDVALLANDGMFPFVVSMSCLNGYFGYPEGWNFPSLAETLLRAENRGAVAAFMPTGMTAPEGQLILDRALFQAIFTQDTRTLGPAIASAKQTLLANGAGYEEVGTTFLLFADPAMTLKIPLPRRVAGLAAEVRPGGIFFEWQEAADCNGWPVAGYNLYRSTAPGEPYAKLNTDLITETAYADFSGSGGTTYYYVVTSVDADGDESVPSLAKAATAVDPTTGGGRGGSASPQQTHIITATQNPHGSISPAGVLEVDHLANITFTLTPNQGYVVADVNVDGRSVGVVSTYTFESVDAAHTISATFVPALNAEPVGGEAGLVSKDVDGKTLLALLVNISNTKGLAPEEITQEWFLFTAIRDGVQLPVFLLTSSGRVVDIATVADFSKATFDYDHQSGDTAWIATASMADLGLGAGDTLLYAYGCTPTDVNHVIVENIVSLKVQ